MRILISRAILWAIDIFLPRNAYNRRKYWTSLLLGLSASQDWTDKTKTKFVKEVLSEKKNLNLQQNIMMEVKRNTR